MVEKIVSVVILVSTLVFVGINTFVLKNQINDIIESIDELKFEEGKISEAENKAREIYDDFKKKETYISVTVNHNDLTNIEESFSELIGYLSVGDSDGAKVTKNRLIDALDHLGRLSGFNIHAII